MNELNIRINKQDLLIILERNKKQHIEDYERAKEGYFKKVKDKLHTMLTYADNNDFRDDNFNVSLAPPKLMTKEYDSAIKMFGLHADETIELTVREYNQYINDDWEWADRIKMNFSSYSR